MVYVAVSFCTPSGHAHFIVSLNPKRPRAKPDALRKEGHVAFPLLGGRAFGILPRMYVAYAAAAADTFPVGAAERAMFFVSTCWRGSARLICFFWQSRARHVFCFLGAAERAAVSCRGAAERANLSASAKHSEVQMF